MIRHALVLIAALGATAARAQIVNVQPLVASERKDGVSFAADLSFDYRAGNIDFLLLSASVIPRFRAGPHLALLLVRIEQGFNGDVPFLSRDFEHLRYRYSLLPRLDLEAFIQHDRDELRRLAARALAGAGPRWVPLEGEPLQLALGLAYLAEYTRLGGGDFPDAGREGIAHRASLYTSVTWTPRKEAKAAVTAYLQPRLDDPGDLRALLELEVLATITGPLSLKTSATVAYDARPPAALERTDIALKAALHLSL